MKKNINIFNRSDAVPSDGWYQIEVSGEHAVGDGRIQVIDEIALNSIVNRFKQDAQNENFTGILVDKDHLSHDLNQTTEALAWVKDLDIRNKQLYAQLDLTDLGELAVQKKRYKMFSTEYAADDLEDLGSNKLRPLRLSGLAFTNRPNNKGAKPISNREALTPNDGQQQQNNNNKKSMNNIAEKLGLPADADEATIVNAITDLLKKVEGMDQAVKASAADAVLNRMGDRVPASVRPQWREQLIANRVSTEKLMEASFPEAKTTPIHNRSAATPKPVEQSLNDATDKANQQESLTQTIKNRDKCSYEAAFEQARREKPELFI